MIVPSVLFQLDLPRPLPALCAQSVTSTPYLANKHASRALQENTARLEVSQLRVETARWALFPPAMPQPPTARHVCQENTAALQACRRHLAIARLLLTQLEAPGMSPVPRVLQEHSIQFPGLLCAPLARLDSRHLQAAHHAKRSSMRKLF